MTTATQADQPQAKPLAPHDTFFQVLTLAQLAGPNGEAGYQMWGPFPDLASANVFSNSKPGSLITLTVVLHQHAQAIAPAPSTLIRPVK